MMACIIPYSILSAYLTYFMFFIEAHTIVTLNHEKFTYNYQGRRFRLTDVEGHVVHDILS